MNKLLFVYNADSGKWNAYLDMAHKIFSPATYPCSLCDLTYGVFKIKPEWDDFVKNAPIPLDFLHKDEFWAQYPDLRHLALPIVLEMREDEAKTLLSAEELNGFRDISSLKQTVLERVKGTES